MAEVVGTIAAVSQFGDVLFKVKKLWSELRNAPRDLTELLEEVVLQAELLDALSLPSAVAENADSVTYTKCTLLLRKCFDPLQALADELAIIHQTHRRTRSLRLHWRKEDVARCRDRLQRVQSLMLQAQQVYNNAVVTQILKEVRHHPHSRKGVRGTSHKSKPIPAFSNTKSGDNQSKHGTKSNKRFNRSSMSTNFCQLQMDKVKNASIYGFHIPLLNTWKRIEFQTQFKPQLFGFNMRIYNIRPIDSEPFRAGRNGDWSKVCQLLSNRTASPFDVDERGDTLLHIAASQARPDICRMLLNEGSTTSCQPWLGCKTPLEALSLAYRRPYEPEPKPKSSVETARILLASGYDDMFGLKDGPKRLSFCSSLPPTTLSFIITSILPSYASTSPLFRSRCAFSTISVDADSIKVLLGHNLDLQQAFKLTSRSPTSGYGHRKLLFNASRCLAKPDLTTKQKAKWNGIISAIIAFESQHTTVTHFRSYYIHYVALYLSSRRINPLRCQGKTINELMTSIGRTWLQILSDCGANLERYSRAERSIADEHCEPIMWSDKSNTFHRYRLKYLFCSPNIEDWKIFVVPYVHKYREDIRPGVYKLHTDGHEEYEMAGSFWDMVENPVICVMPGTFPEEEEQYEVHRGKSKLVKGPIF